MRRPGASPRPVRRAAAALAPLLLAWGAACGGGDGRGATGPASPGDSVSGGVLPAVDVPPPPPPDLPGRGELVAFTPGPRVSRLEVGAVLLASGAGRVFSARHDAQAYVVRYRTPGVRGGLVTASGAVWLPVGAGGARPMVAYLHGTLTDPADAPSDPAAAEGRLYGALWASDGAVAVLPDYLGLGVAREGTYHPYLHRQSTATAGVDLLRAARELARRLNVAVDRRDLFVTGYSQGGHAAVALVQELERHHAGEFPVLGAAAGGGPYDLAGTGRLLLERNADYRAASVYTAFLMATLDTVYRLPPPLGALLAPPHDRTARALLAGVATGAERATLPARPRAVLQPEVAAAMLADTAHPVWRAMRDNDVHDWRPRTPLRLYYGGADRDVPPENARVAEARMRARGAPDVAAVNVGARLDHALAVLPATVAGRAFLDTLRRRLPAPAGVAAGLSAAAGAR